MLSTSELARPHFLIACLCADWCSTCREYRDVFDAMRRAWPQHAWHWVDIEDEAEVMGDLDLETFPTLLVGHKGQMLFAGPVLPRRHDSQRLIEALISEVRAGRSVTPRVAPGDAAGFAEVLRQLQSRD